MNINVPSAARELGPLWTQQLELLQKKGKQTSDLISMLGRVGTEAVMAHATEGASLGMDEGSSKLTRAVGISSAMDRISGRVGMAESMRSLLLTKSAIEKEEGTKRHLAFLTTLTRDVEGGVPTAAAELDLELMDIFAPADPTQRSTSSPNLSASGAGGPTGAPAQGRRQSVGAPQTGGSPGTHSLALTPLEGGSTTKSPVQRGGPLAGAPERDSAQSLIRAVSEYQKLFPLSSK